MRRAVRWAVAGAAVLVAGALAWWLMPRETPLAPVAPMPAVVAAPLPMPPASAPSAVVAVAAVVPPVRAAAPPDKEFVEVCGIGKVRRSELGPPEGEPTPAWMQAMDKRVQQGLSDLARRLDAGTQAQRVAAAVLRDDVQQAALLAVSGSDADAYRIALRACRKNANLRQALPMLRKYRDAAAVSGGEMAPLPESGPEPTACDSLSLGRLEALDDNDAWPWLVRLNESMGRKDAQGAAEALHQLGRRDWRPVRTALVGAVTAPMFGDEPTPDDAMVMTMVMGFDAGLSDGESADIEQACRADMLKDANRRQLCEQAARRMPGMTFAPDDARKLHVLEERLGLPHSPQAISDEELNRVRAVLEAAMLGMVQEPTCANVQRMGQHYLKLVRHGVRAYTTEAKREAAAFAPR